MPPKASPPSAVAASASLTKSTKPHFFYGHRKPIHDRPAVRGGLFTNRKTLNPNLPRTHAPDRLSFDLSKWDPDATLTGPNEKDSSERYFSVAHNLSPIARYIVDSFRKHRQWCPAVVADLDRLRRVTPKLVIEVLKVPDVDPRVSTKFFHWAGKQKGYRHDFACYNAFSYCLNRARQFRAADQVPELMHMQGKPPTEKQFEILVRMHADAGRGLRLYYVYEKMKKFGVKPRVFLYNRIMDALVKTDHLDLAMSVYKDFKEDGLIEESVTFTALIKGSCKAGKIDEAMELLGSMRGKLCKPDVFVYTALVKILVGEENFDGCLRIWKEMQRDGIEPDVMAYTTLVTGLCKGGHVKQAYEFFKEMKKKRHLIDRSIYGSLIEAFVIDGKISAAFDLLQDLMASGYRADLTIYNFLIKGLCSAKHVDKALKLFQVSIQEDLKPDFSTVYPLLLSFADLRRMDDFCRLLEEMQNLGFPVIDELSKFFSLTVENPERLALALELFNILKVEKYVGLPIYNILMEALRRNGDVRKGIALYHDLRDSLVEPDAMTYSIAVQCYVETGEVVEACSCYNKIIDMSLFPSVAAYQSLVKGLFIIGELDAAVTLVQECLANVSSGPILFKYMLSIAHACRSNDAQEVMEVLNDMVAEGGCDDIGYYAIIYGMCKYGTIEEGRKVFMHLREQEYLTEADVIIYDELLVEHMKKRTADLVLSGLKFFGLERKLRGKGSTLLHG